MGPDGQRGNPGTKEAPLSSIRAGVREAEPGDTVYVQPGDYRESVFIDQGGEPDAPVTITGPPEAKLQPPESNGEAAIAIRVSHVHLTGLTIDGLYGPSAPKNPDSYHPGELIAAKARPDSVGDGYIRNLVISPHRIGNSGSTMINIERVRDSEIGGFKLIGPAGASWLYSEKESHVGEIVYLGTPPSKILSDDFPYDEYDQTRNIRVHHIDNTEGHPHSELVDCKVGTQHITIEYCTDLGRAQWELDGEGQPAILIDGHHCTVRWCRMIDSQGPAIQIGPQSFPREDGGWLAEPETDLERKMGTEHAVYGNVLKDYTIAAIDFLRERKRPGRNSNPTPADQRHLCGNEYDGEPGIGTPGEPCSDDVPETDTIGHLGGNSPWD